MTVTRLRAGMLALVAALVLAAASTFAAVDNGVCTTADKGGVAGAPCPGTTLISNANEELSTLAGKSVTTLSSVAGTNAITANAFPGLTGYTDGQTFLLRPIATNTGAVTLSISGVGAKPLKSAAGAALGSGDVQFGTQYIVSYYGANDEFRVLTNLGTGTASASSPYVTVGNVAGLTAERAITAGPGLIGTDGGGNGAYTLGVDTNAISNSMLRQSAAQSVIGRSGGAAGNVADITATANGQILYRNTGGAVVFGTPTAANIANAPAGAVAASDVQAAITELDTEKQPLDSDLTALATLAVTGLYVNTGVGTATARTLTGPAAGITVTNGDGVAGNPTLGLSNDLAAAEGLATTGIVRRTAADTWSAGTAVAGSEIATNTVTDTNLRQGAAASVVGRSAATVGNVADIASSADGQVLRRTGGALAFGTPAATEISNTPSGTIAATTVQAAIDEAVSEAQPIDSDLTALAGNASAGLWASTAVGSGAARTLTAPAAGLTITNPAGTAGNPTFALANDLGALEGLGATGFGVRTAADTWAQRTITVGTGVAVTNGDGVAGNPALALDYSDAGADPALAADQCRFTTNATVGGHIVCEGDTADTFETRIAITDPTADRTMTIPNADSVAVQPFTCGSTDKISSISAAGVVTCSADAGGGGGGTPVQINTAASAAANFNDTSPAAPAGSLNIKWQRTAGSPDSISAYAQDVVQGPASATDTAIPVYNGATGKLIKNSGVGITSANELALPNVTSPTTPATDTLDLYGVKRGGRMLAHALTANHIADPLQPSLAFLKTARLNATGNSTVLSAEGFLNLTVVGTPTIRNVASTNLFTRVRRLGYVSVATAGGLADVYSTAAQWTIGDGSGLGGFFFAVRFGTSDAATVSGARMFVGMRNAVAAPTNVEPNTLTNAVGVCQLSTSTNLQICYGGSAAQTAIDLGANFPASTLSADMYEVIFDAPPNSQVINYEVKRLGTAFVATGQLTGTVGTVIPAATTFVSPVLWRTNNATALAVGLDLSTLYIESDY